MPPATGLIGIHLAVRAARDVEVHPDARDDLAHDERGIRQAAGRVVDADQQALRFLAAHQLASQSLRAEMSRAVFDAPMMWP